MLKVNWPFRHDFLVFIYLQITVHRTMQAIVVLRGIVIEKVLVKGFNEQVHNDNGKVS